MHRQWCWTPSPVGKNTFDGGQVVISMQMLFDLCAAASHAACRAELVQSYYQVASWAYLTARRTKCRILAS